MRAIRRYVSVRTFGVLFWALLLASPLQAQPSQAVERGGEPFNANCVVCHGAAGVGNRAPALRGDRLTVSHVSSVITAGKPGTMMPSFAKVFTHEQVRQLALYVRSVQRPDSPWALLRGTASAGERVFFEPEQTHSCHVCHSTQKGEARIGPDLSAKLKGWSPREIFEKIVIVPHRSADPAYASVDILTRSGERIVGIKGEETEMALRLYETSELPPKVVTIAKADIVSTRPARASGMPSDYASRLSLQHLLDLVAFLKTGADGRPTTVGFNDIISDRPALSR